MLANLHGGFCCGIKHISGLSHPDYDAHSREALSGDQTSFDRHSSSPAVNDMHREMYGEDFFYEAAPKEKLPDRLRRVVGFIKKHRKHGLIEVVIQKIGQAKWASHLEEIGFKMVTEFKNSNTAAVLQVWHLAY
jgi:hypothetical protein